MGVPAPLLDACVTFAEEVSPEAVARVIELLEAGETTRAGAVLTGDAARCYTTLVQAWHGCSVPPLPGVVADVLRGASRAVTLERRRQTVELVWSGPSTMTSTLRSTGPALLDLILNARESIHLVTFAAYRVPGVAAALAAAVQRGVRVVCVLESASGGKVDFDPLPHLMGGLAKGAEVYVWPPERRLQDPRGRRGTLHAKFAVADRKRLLVSSANLTEFAFNLNIELGVMLTGGTAPADAAGHVDQMIRLGIFRQIQSNR